MRQLFSLRSCERGQFAKLGMVLLTSALPALAVPYATGLTNTGTAITFRLNETADMVRVIYNNGASSLMLGARPAGVITTNVAIAGPFKVEVTKTSAAGYLEGAALQISSDANTLLQWEQPVGVAVNKNPKSPYFGRIYVSNSRALPAATGRPGQDGIYVLNPDFTDALGQGNNALTGGIDFTDQSGATQDTTLPWRVEVGEDDNLYISDFTRVSGTIYVTDPNVSAGSGTNALEGLGSPGEPNASWNHGQIASSPIVTGSLADANLTIYALDADMGPINGLKRFDVNEGPFPSPAVMIDLSSWNSPLLPISRVIVDLDRAPDGKFFLSQYRSVGSEGGLFVLSSTDTNEDGALEVLYNSLEDSRLVTGDENSVDLLRNSYAIKVSPDGKYLAIGTQLGPTTIVPLDPATGLPQLANRKSINTAAAGPTRDVAFDAAGNLYIVNNNIERLRVFSPGGRWVATTGSDGTFIITNAPPTIPDITISSAFTNLYERVSQQAATVAVTRVGDATSELTVNIECSGTAVSGVDYEPVPATLKIGAGASSTNFVVRPVNNTDFTGDRTLIISLSTNSNYNVVASAGALALRIVDDETQPGTVLFSDDFESDSSARYAVLFDAADGIEDYTAEWAYDYSQDGIPAAPHSAPGTAKGLRLRVNKDGTGSPAALTVFPKSKTFEGDFALRADVYISVGTDAGGTTEHTLFGINHSGIKALRHGKADGDGLWFAVDGDGSDNRGFAFYGTADATAPTLLKSSRSFDWAFPSPPYGFAGAPNNSTNRVTGQGAGGIWADVEVRQQAGIVTMNVNGTTLFTITNSYAYTNGTVMLGHNDQFASVGSLDTYSLWDNLRVVQFAPADMSVNVTGIRLNGANVTIEFTAAALGAFTALSSATLNGLYSADASVTIATNSPGAYRATAPVVNGSRFFKFGRQ